MPPDYKDKAPEGYTILPSDTYQGYALLRSVLKSGADIDLDKAIVYANGIKMYPLSQAANPPSTTFVDAMDVEFDATIPYDVRFFESLDRMVQAEPWLPRDKVMIDMLKSIGIEKGKPFKPDQKMQDVLNRAARDAHQWFDMRYETSFRPYYTGRRWFNGALDGVVKTAGTFWEAPDVFPVDDRGLTYYYAFSSIKHLGAGQFYLMTIADSQGQPLDGGKTYSLKIPPNAPVKQYWSATVYDRATHAFIRNLSRPNRSSQSSDIQKNGDGSVTIYFAPNPPGGEDSNWIPTSTGGRFEVLFRLYGPEQALFDKTWMLPDIEEVK